MPIAPLSTEPVPRLESDLRDSEMPLPAQGPVEALLNNHSLVRGSLLPFRDTDAIVEIAMAEGDGAEAPMRLRRELLRALKLAGWPSGQPVELRPRRFRFEFNDAEALSGECVSVLARPRGTWLRVLQPGGVREYWFIDTRECVRASVGDRSLLPQTSSTQRSALARPESLESLWSILETSRPSLEGAPQLGEALLRGGWIDREVLQRARDIQQRDAAHPALGRILVDLGALSEVQLRMALADWMGVRVIDPRDFVPEPAALRAGVARAGRARRRCCR